jgi:hypothetical protein
LHLDGFEQPARFAFIKKKSGEKTPRFFIARLDDGFAKSARGKARKS